MQVELVDRMGNDLSVVDAARVSFDKRSVWEVVTLEDGTSRGVRLSDKDVKLINYLAKHNHFTPFTHPQITLRETVPIFVARQRFKHVVGFSYNEVSRRYVDEEPEMYRPEVWRKRPDASIKQGSGGAYEHSEELSEAYNLFCDDAGSFYNTMIKEGVCPEQARMVLPQSMYTSYYVTGSLAAFGRLCKQRFDPTAQAEIQELARSIAGIIEPLFPVSFKALLEE